MKRSKLLFFALPVALACSKSESPAPALEKTQVNFTAITPPTGLSSSSDQHAQTVVFDIDEVNSLGSFASYFVVPATGATKTSVITATNGRVAATTNTTVTYIWTDPQNGSVAFQVTDEGTSYHWEYFYKVVGATSWLKYIDANEKKDNTQGTMKVYEFGGGGDPSTVDFQYDWTKTSDQLNFTYTDNFMGDYFTMNVNTTTKAGTINSYSGTSTSAKLAANYTWGADGHGSWKEYDVNGINVTSSGTW